MRSAASAIRTRNCSKSFKKGRSPGNDGLTYEFYLTFWDDIKEQLLDCYRFSFDANELSVSQKQSIITLIDKKDKDRHFIQNWRPISLLNFDYKLLTKALSARIKIFLPKREYGIAISQL